MSLISRIVLVFCPLLVAACDGGGGLTAPIVGSNNIVITRADGTPINFAPTVWAWCGPWEEGLVPEPTVHVLVGGQAGRWEFRAVRRDIQIGQRLDFPNTFIWDQPRGADMFVHDPPNELSTQASASAGGVTVEQLDCSPRGHVRFRVEAVIGSEFGDGSPVSVTGSFSAPLTGPPGG